MKAAIVLDVDDEAFRAHVEEVWEDVSGAGPGPYGPKPTPSQYLTNRLQEVCEDELPVTFWGWQERFQLKFDVVPAGEIAVVLSAEEAYAIHERPNSAAAVRAGEKIRAALLST